MMTVVFSGITKIGKENGSYAESWLNQSMRGTGRRGAEEAQMKEIITKES